MATSSKTTFRYAFTLTLKPVMYKYTSEEQYDKTYLLAFKHVRSRCVDLTMVAEHTKAFNIHYHGMLKFPWQAGCDPRKKFVDSFRNHPFIGFVNIKQIEDEPGWIDYIKKDLKQTRDMLNRPPIIADDFTVLQDPLTLDIGHMQQYDLSDEQ